MARQVVLAIFPDEASADYAVDQLKAWDKLDSDVKLNAIGVLVLGDDGKVKQHKLGRHRTGKGAGIGFILGLIGFALTPILGIGLLGWTAIGAIAGRLVHKSVGMSKEDLSGLAEQLRGGKAAVGVLVDDVQAPEVAAQLESFGGEPEAHPVQEDELVEAAAADVVEPEAPAEVTPEAPAEAPARATPEA
jgi:uncharacterized membrane protein